MTGKPYTRFRLSNGLDVLLQNVLSFYSVVVCVSVKAGPRYEDSDTEGLAHFLEHMLFEGTKKYPSSKEVARQIEKIGGQSSAWTEKERVVYCAKVPKDRLEDSLKYLSDILFHSLISEESVKTEKGIVLEELHRKRDNPEVEIWDDWLECVWGKNNSLGRSTIGTEDSISAISKKRLEDYLRGFYFPGNMAISIVGDFSLNKARKWIEKYFAINLKCQRMVNSGRVEFLRTPKSVRIKKADTEQLNLMMGFLTGVSSVHQDRYALELISDILFTGFSSRISHKIVYELGISYFFGGSNWFFSDTGLFNIFGGFSKGNVVLAIKTIMEEIRRLKKDLVKPIELEEAKQKGKAQTFFSHETPDTLADFYSRQQLFQNRIFTVEDTVNSLNRVTSKDVHRVINTYFDNDKLRMVLRGPISTGMVENIERLLET